MGAYGAALIAREKMSASPGATSFYGFKEAVGEYRAKSIECHDCSNLCEVIEISSNGYVMARWGDRCGKWSNLPREASQCQPEESGRATHSAESNQTIQGAAQ